MAFVGGLFTPPAQAPVALDDVCRAIGSGDVANLTAIMDAEVELSIMNEEELYSKAAATEALKTFFTAFSPTSFGKVHQGTSKSNDAEYCIGTLTTNKGSFRVYIYVARRGSSVFLQELKFDKNE